MAINKEEVKHLAKLSRIDLNQKEIETYSNQLSSVLDYIDMLNELNTENIEETYQVTGIKNNLREDIVIDNTNDLLGCSILPIKDNQIQVKKVL